MFPRSLLLVVLACASIGCGAKQHEVVSEAGKFKVVFPARPEVNAAKDGKTIHSLQYGDMWLRVESLDVSEGGNITPDQAEKALKNIAKRDEQALDEYGIVTSKFISLPGNFVGVETTASDGITPVNIRRTGFTNSRLYWQEVYCGRKYLDHEKVIKEFFDSFEVLP